MEKVDASFFNRVNLSSFLVSSNKGSDVGRFCLLAIVARMLDLAARVYCNMLYIYVVFRRVIADMGFFSYLLKLDDYYILII